MEAVILTFDEYKHLADLEEMFEYFEVKDMLDERMKNYNTTKNVNWSSIKE
jgi:hypothetical protein